jgi:hypothetical protein
MSAGQGIGDKAGTAAGAANFSASTVPGMPSACVMAAEVYTRPLGAFGSNSWM